MSLTITWNSPSTAGGHVAATNMDDPTAYPGGLVSFDVTVDGERMTDLSVRLYDVTGTTLLATEVLMAGESPKPQWPGTKTWDVVFPALTPGGTYKVKVTRAGTVTSSGTPTGWQRTFRHAVGEVVYPVSLGTTPQNIALSLTTPSGQYPVRVWYKAATGPLSGDATGSWSTSVPATLTAPAYLHIKLRLQFGAQVNDMTLAWRSA